MCSFLRLGSFNSKSHVILNQSHSQHAVIILGGTIVIQPKYWLSCYLMCLLYSL